MALTDIHLLHPVDGVLESGGLEEPQEAPARAVLPRAFGTGPPQAFAGADVTGIAPWSTVTLLGSDIEGTNPITARNWSSSGGPVLSGSGTTRTYTAPGTLNGVSITFTYSVTASDGTATDTVVHTILPVTERAVVSSAEVPMRLMSVSAGTKTDGPGLVATSLITAVGNSGRTSAAAVAVAGGVTPGPRVGRFAGATLTAAAAWIAAARAGTASRTVTATVTAAGTIQTSSGVTRTVTATVTATGTRPVTGQSTRTVTATVTATK